MRRHRDLRQAVLCPIENKSYGVHGKKFIHLGMPSLRHP